MSRRRKTGRKGMNLPTLITGRNREKQIEKLHEAG